MRRPVFIAGIMITLFCLIYILCKPHQKEILFQEEESIIVSGRVIQKEVSYGVVNITISHYKFMDKSVRNYRLNQSFDTNMEQDFINGSKELHKIICYMEEGSEPSVGSRVVLEGSYSSFQTARNPGEFHADDYYANHRIGFALKKCRIINEQKTLLGWMEILYKIRRTSARQFEKYMSREKASVMKAVLLGMKKEMDNETKLQYQRSGISHILAISGLHITLIGMGLYQLLKRMGMWRISAGMLSGMIIVLYGLMVGLTSSSVRAIVMFCLMLVADSLHRTYDLLTAIAVACIMILFENPYYLADSGFQLSFSAVLAIGLIFPMFRRERDGTYGKKKKTAVKTSPIGVIAKKVSSSMKGSLIITGCTMPAVLSSFFCIPFGSVIINLVVLPCMPVLMIMGGLVILTGVLIPSLAFLPAFICELILLFFDKVSMLFSGLNVVIGKPEWKQLLLYLLCMGLLLAVGNMRMKILRSRNEMEKRNRQREDNVCYYILWLCMCAACAVLLCPIKKPFEICFLDVGQGDGIVIHQSCGHATVIDGGSTDRSSIWKYTMEPYLKSKGVRVVDYWVITHPDKDHMSGLSEYLKQPDMSGIRVECIVFSEKSAAFDSDRMLEEKAKVLGIPVKRMTEGDVMVLGAARLICLYPKQEDTTSQSNDASLVMHLEYDEFDGLLTGDADGNRILQNVEEAIANQSIELLKVCHHGSALSNPDDFLKLVSPMTAVISCGRNNSYGHPHEATLSGLGQSDSRIYITYDTGALTYSLEQQEDGRTGFTITPYLETENLTNLRRE